MELIKDPHQMAQWGADHRSGGSSIGLVPTMGALHMGHMLLIERALMEVKKVVCSIFVNPLQFNDPEDLKKYPRQLEADLALLEAAGCHAVFAPEAEAMFRGHVPVVYDLGVLGERWEGPARPGHFQGMVNVVERLFFYARPDRAFFGEKDRQQLAIVRHVARILRWPVEIVPCPTVREPDGLAMSSRNVRLSPRERAVAPIIYRALRSMQETAFMTSVQGTLAQGWGVLATCPEVEVEYIGVVREHDLAPIADWEDLARAVILIAARLGGVRLIDNITLERGASAA